MTSPGIIFEENAEIPMRDGVLLRANVYRPEAAGEYPTLVERTPYGKTGPGSGVERYVLAGYAVVSQDCRGRYASDGDWIPFTVTETADPEDGYDTVEWAAGQPWCNGKVGTMGVSYCGWTQWMLAKLRPPHLVAMAARSIPLELTAVDWPGAFKPARRLHWWLNTMAPDLRRRQGLPPPHTPAEARQIWDEVEQGQLLHLLPASKILRYLPPGLAEYAEDWLKNPGRKAWRFDEAHAEIEVPNLDISGWYDHCNDSIRHLAGMQQNARTERARTQTRLIAGPWSHVGLCQQKQGNVDFGPEAALDHTGIVIRWFDYWLKGIENGVADDPIVRYFAMGEGAWRTATTWPPEDTKRRDLYLDSGGRLADAAPGVDAPPDRFRYDPDNPVPTLWSPQFFTQPGDRRRLDHRQDILRYLTEPLEEDIEIAGDPEVVLYASSSAPDTDFFARLADDEPGGPALEACYGMIRARHRNSLEVEELLTPGDVTEFRIKLGPTACCFRKGHRIRLEITSSDYPNHDRNHNVGRNDLYDAELAIADQAVFHTAASPSRLILPVV